MEKTFDKKCLLITTDFPPDFGGVANYWANLSTEIAQKVGESNYFVLAPENEKSDLFDVQQNYIIFRKKLLGGFWPKWRPIIFHALKIIKQKKINHVFVTQILPVGTIALILMVFCKITYSVSVHGLDLAWTQKSTRKKFLTKLILKYASQIIVNSKFTLEKIKNIDFNLLTKAVIIYPCPNYQQTENINCQEFLQKNEWQNKKIILSVGRLVERKGFDLMIKAMPKVLAEVPDAIYLIYGKGQDENRLRDLINKNSLQDKVFLITDENKEVISNYFANCQIFVMPCRELKNGDVEGFGIVYLEANLFGKPTIAGNSGGASEAVIDGQTGLVISPNDENALAEKVIFLLQNADLAKKMGEAGRQRVLQEFTWGGQAEKIRKSL